MSDEDVPKADSPDIPNADSPDIPTSDGTDYYQVLGIERSIDNNRLTKAFRKLALKYHPDKNPNSEEKFKEIAKAYKVLSDPETRKIYDEAGPDGLSNYEGASDEFRNFNFTWKDFEKLFEHFDADRRRTKDVKEKLEVTLEEIFTGVIKILTVQKYVLCDGCKDLIEDCDNCKGYGKVKETRCLVCKGLGYIDHASYTCERCSGTNIVPIAKSYPVEIKPGLYNGQHIPFLGEGDEEPGALPGDRIFVAKTLDHYLYTRVNFLDLATEVVITSAQKHTPGGHEVVLPTLDGQEMSIRLPEGINNGRTLEIPDAGLPDYFAPSKRGYLYVNIKKVKSFRKIEQSKPSQPAKNEPKRSSSFHRFDFMRNSLKGRRNDPNVRKSMPEFFKRQDPVERKENVADSSLNVSIELNYENPQENEKPVVETEPTEETRIEFPAKIAKQAQQKRRSGLFRTSFRKKKPECSTPIEDPPQLETPVMQRISPTREVRFGTNFKEKRRSKGFLTNLFFN